MSKLEIGLIGILGQEYEADLFGTLEKVARLGYVGIEGGEMLLKDDIKENIARFKGLGLKSLSISGMREALRDDLESLIENAHLLECDRVSMWYAPCTTREEILQDCELYNAAGAKLISEGIKLCYHNHAHELQNTFDGVNALDIIAFSTDPKAVFFELDIAWLAIGGANPVEVLKRYAGRVPALHIKDAVTIPTSSPEFTTIGSGAVDLVSALAAAVELGIPTGVVEQDRLRNLSAWQTVEASMLYLKEVGFAT